MCGCDQESDMQLRRTPRPCESMRGVLHREGASAFDASLFATSNRHKECNPKSEASKVLIQGVPALKLLARSGSNILKSSLSYQQEKSCFCSCRRGFPRIMRIDHLELAPRRTTNDAEFGEGRGDICGSCFACYSPARLEA